MRVISRKRIVEFTQIHPEAAVALETWYHIVRKAVWHSLADVRRTFRHADVVGRRTVFNVMGNHFRLVARVNYRRQIVYILAVLTHKEYDQWEL